MANTMANSAPYGKDRRFMLEQADLFLEESCVMRKIEKGWKQFNVEDPWDVVHPPKIPWLPRYHSEPILTSLAANSNNTQTDKS